MTRTLRVAAALVLAAAVLTGTAGCGAKQAVKTVVEQGVEPTSTGPHNTAPANNAENAVQNLNGTVQQTQQEAGTGQ